MTPTPNWAGRLHRLRSTGGRPTNPDWTLKRQIPFSPELWAALNRLAEECSQAGTRIGPGQLAAFLLEDAVEGMGGATTARSESGGPTSEEGAPTPDGWKLGPPFALAPTSRRAR